MNADEQAKVRAWFAAYDPAVVAEVTATEVVVTSCRRRRERERERAHVRRSADLTMDLNAALAQLVLAAS